MKNTLWFILLGIGLLSLLMGALVYPLPQVLAQEPAQNGAGPTEVITPTIRFIGADTDEEVRASEESEEMEIPAQRSGNTAPISALDTNVCGNVSGTWDAGGNPFVVTCDIVITTTDTLTIQPGVEVRFNGDYRLFVYGDLLANGAAAAPITFTSHLASPQPGDWRGIQFYESGDDDRLSYVRVEFARTGIEIKAEKGTASPTVENSVITNSQYDGISIIADATTGNAYARPQILNNTISYNGSDGIYIYGDGGNDDYEDGYAQPLIRGNVISGNSATGIYLFGSGGSDNSADGYAEGDISDNIITANGSYGIRCYGSGGSWGCFPTSCILGSASPDINGNVIADNDGTGIYMSGNGSSSNGYSNTGRASPLVVNNIVVSNGANGLYAYAWDSYDQTNPKIINNTVVENTEAGIRTARRTYSTDIYNNLIISNTVGLRAYSTTETPDVSYNDIWGNTTNFNNYPSSYGEISTANANGAPSDLYFNIYLDPRFDDASIRNYYLHSQSPAVDAGYAHAYAPDNDIDGNSRPKRERYDLGAYEAPSSDNQPPLVFLPVIIKDSQ